MSSWAKEEECVCWRGFEVISCRLLEPAKTRVCGPTAADPIRFISACLGFTCGLAPEFRRPEYARHGDADVEILAYSGDCFPFRAFDHLHQPCTCGCTATILPPWASLTLSAGTTLRIIGVPIAWIPGNYGAEAGPCLPPSDSNPRRDVCVPRAQRSRVLRGLPSITWQPPPRAARGSPLACLPWATSTCFPSQCQPQPSLSATFTRTGLRRGRRSRRRCRRPCRSARPRCSS